MDKITHAGTTLLPTLVLGYKSRRISGNKTHTTVGSTDVGVTFKGAGLRTGTLVLLFPNEAAALAAENLHSDVGTFVFTSDDLPLANMTYIPNGVIEAALDSATRLRWTVSIEYQEVLP